MYKKITVQANLDIDGNWQWAVSAGGADWDEGYAIVLDNSESIYVTGYFDVSAIFGPTTLTSEGEYDVFITKLSLEGENSPPNKPRIEGQSNGKVGTSYEYIFTSADPEGDDVYFYVNWDNGTNSGWIGPFISDQETIVNHTWIKQGKYTIQAKANDEYDAESDWGNIRG